MLEMTFCLISFGVKFMIDLMLCNFAWSLNASHQQSPNPGVSLEVRMVDPIDSSFLLILVDFDGFGWILIDFNGFGWILMDFGGF